MKIKCVIIDDEPLAIKVVENHLKEFQNFEVIETFKNKLDKFYTKSVEGNLVEIATTKIPISRKYVHHAKRIILNID